MKELLPAALLRLSENCPRPLYLVGGTVRDHLLGYPLRAPDFDLASPMTEEEFLAAAERCRFTVRAVYRATGTVKLEDETGAGYEFTRFRSDRYVRGLHVPAEIEFTEEIEKDAKRRDFCANAVYFDLKSGEYVDPLGGRADIGKKILRTVAPAEKVFGEDGLRLLRLARIAAQIGFSPDEECLEGAKKHAELLRDIVPERIFAELKLLLHADEKHGIPKTHYHGLCVLKETGVLNVLLPELTLGEGMMQRPVFHRYDVLEHSLRCAMYAAPEVRFAALLHDVGKPFCYLRDGNYHLHTEEGAKIAAKILARWKAPKKFTDETVALVALHMRDYNLEMKENKVRRELVTHYPLLDRLFLLKQADYSACKDDLSPAPAVVKWKEILGKMKAEGAPLTLSDLAVKGDDLLRLGCPAPAVGGLLEELLFFCAEKGERNRREPLLDRAKGRIAAMGE